jgi:hypothetical protein
MASFFGAPFTRRPNEYEVPSESCFLRVLQGVSALEVEAILLAWQDQVLGPNTDPLVAIDGKTLKHSGAHWRPEPLSRRSWDWRARPNWAACTARAARTPSRKWNI